MSNEHRRKPLRHIDRNCEAAEKQLMADYSSENSVVNDDDIKTVMSRISPSVYSRLWDGMIQLNGSVKVSMSAFFKSGEKLLDIVWPDTIEIKGRVKLEAFVKFVKDLRYSRNRSIMVISLCCNIGSLKDGLEGIKEVATSFEVNQRVGFAEIDAGPYVYVCPRSKAILTVLAQYGFWKGMSTVDSNQDSLIGFVVWDRKQPVNTSAFERSIEKIQETQGTHVEAQDVTYDFPSRCVHVDKTGETVYRLEAVVQGLPLQPRDATGKAIHPDLATKKNHMIGALSDSMTQQKYASSDEPQELQQKHPSLLNLDSSHTPDDEEDLPEFDFSPACEAEVKPNVDHPLNKDTPRSGQFQKPSHSFFQARENVGAEGTSAYMVSSKIPNPISHYNMERECFRENNGFHDGDRMMWHSSELDQEKLLKNGSTSLNPPRDEGLFFHHSPDVEAERGLFPQHPHLVSTHQGLFHGHRPPPLLDQGLYPMHPPHVLADQRLFRQHPPQILAEQGSPHPPPGLPNQGLHPQHPPRLPADQCLFHPYHPRVLGDQGFISHRPPLSFAPGYFGSSGYHGNNNGASPDQRHNWMFGQLQTSYASAIPQRLRPPSCFPPGLGWRPIFHPRPGNNHYGAGNGSASMPPNLGN